MCMANDRKILPHSLPPRGLSRAGAAAYVGISPTLFDAMVKDGRMPSPIRMNARTIWDRFKIDEAFDELQGESASEINPWDE